MRPGWPVGTQRTCSGPGAPCPLPALRVHPALDAPVLVSPCAPQVPQPGCRLQSAAEGGYVCTRQRGPFSSLRSFQRRQEPQWVVTLQVQSITRASGKTWQSTRASTVVWDVPLDGRVTLRLFSVTQEDGEVQRDDRGSDKTVET